MVLCCMVGCSMRSIRDKISFHRLPGQIKSNDSHLQDLAKLRRSLWLARICRSDVIGDERKLKHMRVCGKHFIKGFPSQLTELDDPDWAPSQHLGHNFFDKDKERSVKKRKCKVLGTKTRSRPSKRVKSTPPVVKKGNTECFGAEQELSSEDSETSDNELELECGTSSPEEA